MSLPQAFILFSLVIFDSITVMYAGAQSDAVRVSEHHNFVYKMTSRTHEGCAGKA